MNISKRTVSILLLIFVMVVWGSAFAVTKVAVREIPPYSFAFLRFGIATLSLLVYMWVSGRRLHKFTRRQLMLCSVLGLTGVTLYYAFFNLSIKTFPASLGALVQGFIPACITLLAVIFLKERLSLRQILGVLLSVSGVVVLGWGGLRSGNAPLSGLLLMVLSVVAWSVYTIISKKVSNLDSFTVTFYITLSGTVLLVPFMLTEASEINLTGISLSGWVAMLYLGVIGSALCYFLYSRALETLSASQIGTFMNLDPIIGSVIALIFLHESLSALQILGAVLVIIGIFLSSTKSEENSTD